MVDAYCWRVDTADPRAQEGVAAVATGMAGRAAAVSAAVLGVIEREIPVLRDDQRGTGMLEASVSENVTTMLNALRHGTDTATIEAPTSAIEYARRLAQRGVSPRSWCARTGSGRRASHGCSSRS